jgi:hypothetical protein
MRATHFLIAAVAAAFSLPATAQTMWGPFRDTRSPYYEGRSIYGQPLVCEKLCTADMSPCDPPEYKRADGRCSNPLQRF